MEGNHKIYQKDADIYLSNVPGLQNYSKNELKNFIKKYVQCFVNFEDFSIEQIIYAKKLENDSTLRVLLFFDSRQLNTNDIDVLLDSSSEEIPLVIDNIHIKIKSFKVNGTKEQKIEQIEQIRNSYDTFGY